MREDIKSFISKVRLPGRYTGGESGSVIKDKDKIDLRWALCFPDTYEIGMSNLGVKILSGVLNEMDNVWCERVFAPWIDMEEEMRKRRIPLFALESGDDVGEFDFVAFSLSYELSYSNVLNMLSLSNIPLLSSDRDDSHPIVIAGGSFSSSEPARVSEGEKQLLQALLERLDPEKVFFVVGHKLLGHERYLVEHNERFEVYSVIPSLMDQKQIRRLSRANITGVRISTEAQEMGIYKSFNYEIFERRNSVLFAFDGNSAVANLVQEARNGKGKTWTFIYPKTAMLKAKASSLDGYVTINGSVEEVLRRIQKLQGDIGTRLKP